MESTIFEQFLANEDDTLRLGSWLSSQNLEGSVIYLRGHLGAGKTTMSRGILQALGHVGAVKSPTYTLVEEYEYQGLKIHHFDLYRLGDPEELEYMGIRDYFGQGTVNLIEWDERGTGYIAQADLIIELNKEQLGRRVVISAQTKLGCQILNR